MPTEDDDPEWTNGPTIADEGEDDKTEQQELPEDDESIPAGDYENYSEEELQDIWDNDIGYISENAMKELPSEDGSYDKEHGLSPDSLYVKEGFHDRGESTDWGPAAVEGTSKDILLEPDQVLARYGDEKGSNFADPTARFEDLHLDVSEDKMEKSYYIVKQPLPAVQSEIAGQPFDPKNMEYEKALKYKTTMNVEELIDKGYMEKICPEELDLDAMKKGGIDPEDISEEDLDE